MNTIILKHKITKKLSTPTTKQKGACAMDNLNANRVTPPDEDQVTRVLNLFKRLVDPFQRGKVLGKLEAYVEQAENHDTKQSA